MGDAWLGPGLPPLGGWQGLTRGGLAAAAAGLRRAVVLVGSQKTLPIAVAVLNQLAAFVDGPLGLAVIPCVVAHLSQILVDSMLVSRWLSKDAAEASSE